MKVINRKNITISHLLATSTTFNRFIPMTFTPDTMIIRQITYCGPANPASVQKGGGGRLIRCSGVNDYIGSFIDGCTVSPNTTFTVNNSSVNTEWQFSIHAYDGSVDITYIGTLYLHLEFLQHEK